MPDQVPEQKKTERSNILLSLEKKMSEEFRNYYVGKEKTALLEEELVVDGKHILPDTQKSMSKWRLKQKKHGKSVRDRKDKRKIKRRYLSFG